MQAAEAAKIEKERKEKERILAGHRASVVAESIARAEAQRQAIEAARLKQEEALAIVQQRNKKMAEKKIVLTTLSNEEKMSRVENKGDSTI